jgi:hypothetical protein
MDDSRLRGFLADSLALWRVAGKVAPGEEPVVAVVQADDGALVWIERASGEGMPCRWLVRWRGAGEAPGAPRETRPRACASVVGMLGAVRGALGVNRGMPVRIAR